MLNTQINPIAVFSEWFTPQFVEHVRTLQTSENYRNGFQDAVRATVSKHGYTQWLKSPKWRATAKLKRLLKPYCEHCYRGDHLEIHHSTYEHIGIEVLYLDDLVVLCSFCHPMEHGIDTAFTDRIELPGAVRPHQMRMSFEPGHISVEPAPPYWRR